MSTILTAVTLLAAAPGLLISTAEPAAALRDPATVVVAVGNSGTRRKLPAVMGPR